MSGDRGDIQRCLVLHGLGGGPYELEPLVVSLQAAGIHVELPWLKGHDGPGPVMPASNWMQWYRTALDALDRIEHDGQGPVAVVGFSTGATLALLVAAHRPVARLALLAPFVEIKFSSWLPLPPLAALKAVAPYLPSVPRRPPAVRDPAMRQWAESQSLYKTFSVEAAASALELIEKVKPLVPALARPSVILQGRLDTVVDPAGAVWLDEHLVSSPHRLQWFDQSEHLLALDVERASVCETVRRFLQESGG